MKFDVDKYRFFFFDFDGVIVDSLETKAQAFGALFKDYGEEIVRKVIDYHLQNGGMSRYEKFKFYYNNFLNKKITQEIIGDLDREYSQLVVEKVVKAPYINGVIDFIKELKKKRKKSVLLYLQLHRKRSGT